MSPFTQVICTLLLAASVCSAGAQVKPVDLPPGYPSKTVHIILGNPPGAAQTSSYACSPRN